MQERSLRIRQRVLGPEHPQTLQSLQRLGVAALDQGQATKALAIARKAMFAQTRHLQRVFSFVVDEQQRLAFQATVRPFSVFASLRKFPRPICHRCTAVRRSRSRFAARGASRSGRLAGPVVAPAAGACRHRQRRVASVGSGRDRGRKQRSLRH